VAVLVTALFRRTRSGARSTVTMAWRLLSCMALVALPIASESQVYRCGNAYSHAPCAGAKEIDTSPTLRWDHAKGGATTLYLCQAYRGGQFWTREHCGPRDALVERMESVPGDIPFEQQVELARERVAEARRSQVIASPGTPLSPAPAADRVGRCGFLEERVRHLDAMARAGGHAGYMDWIAHERKTVRDQQFRLRC
jgi:hypothetical protein